MEIKNYCKYELLWLRGNHSGIYFSYGLVGDGVWDGVLFNDGVFWLYQKGNKELVWR